METQTGAQTQAPPGAMPIETEELLAAIGELYVQVRLLRKMLAREQQPRTQDARAVSG
jgi:hypothetical protein